MDCVGIVFLVFLGEVGRFTSMTFPLRSSKRATAFTLVETAMAIGIVAFAMTGLLGVLPLALSELSNARNEIIVAELAESRIAQASQMDFSQLNELPSGSNFLYDVSGVKTSDAARAIYEVGCNLNAVSDHSKVLLVSVYRHPRSQNDRPLADFISLLADNGR